MISRKRIEQALFDMEVTFTGRSDCYVADAIMYIDKNGGLPIKWTTVYYAVGKKRNVSPSAVERGMRRVLENIRILATNREIVEHYIGESDLCVSATLGRFYMVLKSDNIEELEEAKEGDGDMTDADMKRLWAQHIKKLDELNKTLKDISKYFGRMAADTEIVDEFISESGEEEED